MYAGIDLGGTTIAAAVANDNGELLLERVVPTRSAEGPAAVLERMSELVSALAREAGGTARALGVGMPGLVDRRRGRALFLPNMPTQWREVDVRGPFQARLGCPVFLMNDARCAALAELEFGAGRAARVMAFFTLGTGIGGGIAIEGRLVLGPLGAAGEIGHQTIVPDGPVCGCGNRGCLEAVASGPAISAEGVRLLRAGLAPALHEIVSGDAGRVTPKEMAEAAGRGDENVRIALERAGRYIGIAAANLVTSLDADLIVLGGGVAAIGDLLIDTVRAEIRRRVRMFPADGVRVERSALGEKAGLRGAVALAMRGGLAETEAEAAGKGV